MLKDLTVLLAIAGLCATAAVAQSRGQGAPSAIRPDFSGTWSFASWSTTTAGQSRTVMWDSPVKMTQDVSTLTLEYVSGGRNHAPVRLVYNLDGSQGKGVDRNGPSPYDLLLRAEWRETRLVLNTSYIRKDYGNIEHIEVLVLDSPTTMIVEATRKFGDQTLTSTSTWRR